MKQRRCVLIIITSLITTFLMIQLLGEVVVDLGGIEVSSYISLNWKGQTVLFLPPLGMLRADTHKMPISLNFTLQNIHLEFLKSILDNFSHKDQLLSRFRTDFLIILKFLALKLLLVSLLGALLVVALFRLRKDELLVSLAVSLLIPLLLISSLYLTYDVTAFDTPKFAGTLEAAPWIIGLFNNGLKQLDQLRDHLKNISSNISQVFAKIEGMKPLEAENITKVLHVSDIHNNPAALDFIGHVVKSFDADFVVDTGDITDFGTPFEDSFVYQISHLPVPYVFVAGNHDSTTTTEKLEEVENVIILDGTSITIDGIQLLGFADPNSKTGYIETPKEEQVLELKRSIESKVQQNAPDVLLLHNPNLSQTFAGQVPVILNGHYHALAYTQERGTIIINAGTTGAAGIRGFQSKKDIPYTAVMLYFDQSMPKNTPTLVALDTIKISNLQQGFEIQRTYFDP